MIKQYITNVSAEEEEKLKHPIDIQIPVKYQYVENQHSEKHWKGLVKFLAERTFHDKPADGSEGEE